MLQPTCMCVSQITHMMSVHVPDLQLQGVQFIDEDGRAFGCTGYDSNEIIFYQTATA